MAADPRKPRTLNPAKIKAHTVYPNTVEYGGCKAKMTVCAAACPMVANLGTGAVNLDFLAYIIIAVK